MKREGKNNQKKEKCIKKGEK